MFTGGITLDVRDHTIDTSLAPNLAKVGGTLVQAAATSEGYQETGRVQALDGKCWTAPSLAGGKLYLRSHSEMVSYDLKG